MRSFGILAVLGLVASTGYAWDWPCFTPALGSLPAWNDNRAYKPYWYDSSCDFAAPRCGSGVWLPERPALFEPFVADPREIDYSIGVRFNDHFLDKISNYRGSTHLVDVSYGDTIALYRWYDVGMFGADLQIEIEGALWALFAPWQEDSPLINTDYYLGFPITYAFGPWGIRWRLYHISSHLGDEFMLFNPHVRRVNPSSEYTDFFLSYYLWKEIRLYAGGGYILHRDESFPFKRGYGEFGAEYHGESWGVYFPTQFLFIQPYGGMHFRVREDNEWMIDQTYVLGVEIGKTVGLERKMRLFLEYHDGASLEGQFARQRTDYWSIRGSYGY